MFHDIGHLSERKFPTRYKQPSFLDWNEFQAQLDYINSRYVIISSDSLMQDTEYNDNYALLTFDDGLLDHLDVAYYLNARGIPATFFVPISPVIDGKMMHTHRIQFIIAEAKNLHDVVRDILDVYDEDSAGRIWDKFSVSLWPNNYWSKEQVFITRFLREFWDISERYAICNALFKKYVSEDPRDFNDLYLNEGCIKRMMGLGMSIGGHGFLSENFAVVDDWCMKREIDVTKKYLESLGLKHLMMSYPNGGVNDAVINQMISNGFHLGFKTGNKFFHHSVDTPINVSELEPSIRLCIPRVDAAQLLRPLCK